MGESGMKTVEDVGSPLKYEFQVRGPLEARAGDSWEGRWGVLSGSGVSGCEVVGW